MCDKNRVQWLLQNEIIVAHQSKKADDVVKSAIESRARFDVSMVFEHTAILVNFLKTVVSTLLSYQQSLDDLALYYASVKRGDIRAGPCRATTNVVYKVFENELAVKEWKKYHHVITPAIFRPVVCSSPNQGFESSAVSWFQRIISINNSS
jgi:hypothetical protein